MAIKRGSRQLRSPILDRPRLSLLIATVLILAGVSNTAVSTAADAAAAGPRSDLDMRVFTVNPVANYVYVFDPLRGVHAGDIAVGTRPSSLTFASGLNRVYVSNMDSNTVTVIDSNPRSPTGLRAIATIAVGQAPWDITYYQPAKQVYVTNYDSNTITVIDATTNRVVRHIAGVPDPLSIAADSRSGLVYAASQNGRIYIIQAATGALRGSFDVGSRHVAMDLAVAPNSQRLYLADGQYVWAFNTGAGNSLVAHLGVVWSNTPQLAINPAETRLHVVTSRELAVIDTNTFAVNYVPAAAAEGVAVDPWGWVYAATIRTASEPEGLRVINPATNTVHSKIPTLYGGHGHTVVSWI